MTSLQHPDSVAIIETRVAHDIHRAASALLVDAAQRPTVPCALLADLRGFLVENLRHHHETEDHDLWPLLLESAPETAAELERLSDQHERLETALDALAGVPIDDETDGASARAELRAAAAEVRETVLHHLEHEEPVLLPALGAHMESEVWDAFAMRVVTTSPTVAAHLMVGFIQEVASEREAELLFSRLPEPVQDLLPSMREQAAADLRSLRGAEREA
ncbi:hemerythrin domain-containing protein [Nocardiopsis eucommiae]|uniref:Hemerythrin domain-containing protein n=1 Tax=Nocardiopsis eucommiae TaxID=2831970 RepID=A0A975L6S0_9ACTN|nr:hemerythrin domain-containing protein [Nocardiopsis eucommiae]